MATPDGSGSGSGAATLRLLGAAELGGPVRLRFLGERRYRLLAYLALQDGWVHRDQLANLFWPDRSQEGARSNLRKLLFEVRSLGLPGLDHSRQSVRWQIDDDVSAFLRAHAQGDHRSALALYRGTLLHGLDGSDSPAFAAWLRGERSRLRTLWRGSILATVVDAPPQTTIDLCQLLLDDDPFDEDAVRVQMRAFAALDRRTDVARTYRCFAERVAEGLGVDVAIETRNLARELEREKSLPPAQTPDAGSAGASEGFVGRGRELTELQALLADGESRLITVTGPGGMGKSRLVKEVIHRLPASAQMPICWIALDDLADVAQVAPRVARELGIETTALQDSVDLVARHLAPLCALLVFDNSEHLTTLGDLLEHWLAAAPKLKILATSRTRIGLRKEWLVPLRGLDVPLADADAGDAAPESDATRLFVSQARLAQPRFDAAGNAHAVADLVRAVGGMPLAILLAASWVRLLPVTDMVSDLTHLLDVLEQAEEGEERPEHRSVRATFEQSWRLLSPAEQQVLTVLSVFAGTFTRAAVHDVSQAPLPVLGSLIDKSLVQIDRDARCSLHPLIQQFSAHKLAQDPARREVARGQHAASYARMMGQYGHFNSIDQAAALRTIATELPNILAAWEWAIAKRLADVLSECSSGLSNHFQARGPIKTGLELFARAEAAIGDTQQVASDAAWGLALEHAALHYWLGNYQEVEAAGRRALAAGRARKSGFAIRSSLNTVGLALYRQGHLAEAERYLSQAVKRARAEHIPGDVAAFAGNLVAIKRELGDDEGALRLARDALNGHRANGHRTGEISMTNEIGLILHGMGQLAAAIDSYEQGLRLANQADMALRRIQLLTHLASACLDIGDFERARQTGRDALQLALKGGLLAHEPTCRRTLAAIDLATGELAGAHVQLCAAIVAARRIGTALVIGPLLRDCAAYLERVADAAAALRCVACADAHRISKARPLDRYRDLRERLRASLSAEVAEAAEAQGAALGLQAGLDLAEGALGAT